MFPGYSGRCPSIGFQYSCRSTYVELLAHRIAEILKMLSVPSTAAVRKCCYAMNCCTVGHCCLCHAFLLPENIFFLCHVLLFSDNDVCIFHCCCQKMLSVPCTCCQAMLSVPCTAVFRKCCLYHHGCCCTSTDVLRQCFMYYALLLPDNSASTVPRVCQTVLSAPSLLFSGNVFTLH